VITSRKVIPVATKSNMNVRVRDGCSDSLAAGNVGNRSSSLSSSFVLQQQQQL